MNIVTLFFFSVPGERNVIIATPKNLVALTQQKLKVRAITMKEKLLTEGLIIKIVVENPTALVTMIFRNGKEVAVVVGIKNIIVTSIQGKGNTAKHSNITKMVDMMKTIL